MRRRLVTTYLLLLCLVLLALEVPLALVMSGRTTQALLADRLADATRFAALAAPAIRGGDLAPVAAELGRYHELYGIDVIVVDQNRHVVNAAGPHPGPDADPVIRGALAGRQMSSPTNVWPWQESQLLVAVPIYEGGAVLGGILTVSSTERARGSMLFAWAMLGIVGLVALVGSLVAAVRLARWVLRPVFSLDTAVHEITAGDSTARVPHALGPPELRRLTTSFNEMADTVTDALERQRLFVAHASHQLRNPLTVLRLRVEGLGDMLPTEARPEHHLALEESDRLARVLDSLLALARAEWDGRPPVIVDAGELVAARVEAWLPLAVQRGVALTASVPVSRVFAEAADTALDQALDALIDNGLKFAGAGGHVEVSVSTLPGRVVVTVRDNGPGMTAAECRLATRRFWRAPNTQNVDGAGLGLSIATVLIEASGGSLVLAPLEPHGLEARVRLRLHRAEVAGGARV
ncbi:two-component sensor histidine kinase [Asanoa ishikariensis]|uniref:histidine kinase n=1 Tax=Asanoa ishikariensis TaxID=137265 RepID=A0A1H3NAK5_9ACTN|nr:HAMP domain-containing sensor histidine kinase [Asanoa ishikariensis]GIF68754.1 two-component sensor histidine kinase [Asanoa ishikariensis]SDY85783.1 Signal transduction histidine kinase [Asanoa ishikariensis]